MPEQPGSSKPRADQLITRYEELKGERKNFESYWQSLHDYFYVEAADISKTYAPGSELDATYLWDSTTLESADVFASGFMNYLTPPTSKWFRLKHKSQKLTENKAVADYLENVAAEVNYTINRSNFYDQIFPSYKSSGVYGTSFIFEEEDIKDGARFYNMPLKQCLIVEDAKGRGSEYFVEFEYTAKQAESRWGRELLSAEMQRELQEGKGNTKQTFILYIAKRQAREIQKTDKKNLPVEATWVDVKGRTEAPRNKWTLIKAMN